MRKFVLCLCLAPVILLCALSCRSYHASNPAVPIRVSVQDTFVIHLTSNPSTGYHWEFIQEPDPEKILLTGKEYAGGCAFFIGSGGTALWTFKALSEGETQITVGYYHPYDREKKNPGPAVTYRVIIDK